MNAKAWKGFCHTLCKQRLPFVSEHPPRGLNMKDRHNENSKHDALYICQKHIWLYVTSTLLFKTVPSVCEIKAEWYIGSNSRCVKLCQWSKGNHQRLFSVHSAAGWRDLQGLIVHQLEAAEMFFVLWATRLPTQVARTHTTGNLKVQQRSLGTHTHTHKTNTHRHKSSIDPKVNPRPWPLLPLQEQSPAGIWGKKAKKKKRPGSWI